MGIFPYERGTARRPCHGPGEVLGGLWREVPLWHMGSEVIFPEESDKALAFLARLAQEFTALLHLPALVDHVLEALHAEVGFDSCTVALLDERDANSLTIVGATGIRANFRGLTIPRSHGLNWVVMETGAPLLVPDMQADPRVYRRDNRVRSGIYAPLVAGTRPIGVLSAHHGQVHGFTQADLNLLTVVARYLAGAFEVARLHEQLRTLAATDTLTGLMNRRSFLEQLRAELERTRRTCHPVSVALLDLDSFKVINDRYGHATGDAILVQVARWLRQNIRAYDHVGRFGGDEFIVMFPETSMEGASAILRRLRYVDVSGVVADGAGDARFRLSLSWGVATSPDDGLDQTQVLHVADQRLYAMKGQGRTAGGCS